MRFLHTADIQIGMRAAFAGEERARQIRAARLRTLRRIVELANREAVDFTILAGDVFEDRAPALGDIGTVAGALREAHAPVYVVPGNHDPATGATPYAAASWKELERGGMVFTAREPTRYAVPGGDLLVSPCATKYSVDDPTRPFIDMPSAEGAIRVGVAHGTLRINEAQGFDDGEQRAGFPISTDAASRAGLRYLALGHFHSYQQHADGGAIIAYSGTPEQTRFDDRDCGTISIVEIAGSRAPAQVTRVEVHELRWSTERFMLTDESSLDGALDTLRDLAEPDHHLVRVEFSGFGGPGALERLIAADGELAERFLFYHATRRLVPRPADREEWLQAVPVGLGRAIAESLLDDVETGGDAALPASRALEMLAEIAR